MFKRKKRFKPYRMKPIRVKSWREIAWARVMLLVGALGILFALLEELWDSVELVCSDENFGHRHHLDNDDSDLFEHDSGLFEHDSWVCEHDSGMFEHDDDDISRGMWDVTSIYYPMCHPDD